MKINYEKLFEQVEAIRLEKGMSKRKLCEEFDINRSTLYYWTNGEKKPSLQSVMTICTKFGIDITELFEK